MGCSIEFEQPEANHDVDGSHVKHVRRLHDEDEPYIILVN